LLGGNGPLLHLVECSEQVPDPDAE
jgi:hypothetical protein